MIPAGRYEELRFSYDYGTDDEAVWCFNDSKLCAIYDKQGRKIATAPIPIEDCAHDGGYDWPQLGLYSAGDRIIRQMVIASCRQIFCVPNGLAMRSTSSGMESGKLRCCTYMMGYLLHGLSRRLTRQGAPGYCRML